MNGRVKTDGLKELKYFPCWISRPFHSHLRPSYNKAHGLDAGKIISASIRPQVLIKRVEGLDFNIIKALIRLQESVFGCPRHARKSQLIQVVSCPETTGLFVALHGKRVCGFVLVERSSGKNQCFIRGIGVLRAYRSQGVGSKLLSHAVGFAVEIRAQILVSYVDRQNLPSLGLHRKLGFHEEKLPGLLNPELRRRLVFRTGF